MKDTLSETLAATVQEKRVIGKLLGREDGPTLVFFGGIHGNEPAGVKALQRVFEKMNQGGHQPAGNVYGLVGNLQALEQGKRFIASDLNRMWHSPPLDGAPAMDGAEAAEMQALHRYIGKVLDTHRPPFYFIDLHTTSSRTLPFITINDALINRKFAQCFPVPVILGIEEYLNGPLLSYMNEKGYLGIGFESGQHEEEAAVTLAESFIWMALVRAGAFNRGDVPGYDEHFRQLRQAAEGYHRFYEITYRHFLEPGDSFSMFPGFQSFQKVSPGTQLATYNGKPIRLDREETLFMPLYQKQGEDGYFLIRSIPAFLLALSELLRRVKLEGLLPLLPGISRLPGNPGKLLVNLRWTPFLSKQFFHLLGYRHRYLEGKIAILNNRERTARKHEYQDCSWYRGIFRNFRKACP